jgi:hypothetical protein
MSSLCPQNCTDAKICFSRKTKSINTFSAAQKKFQLAVHGSENLLIFQKMFR